MTRMTASQILSCSPMQARDLFPGSQKDVHTRFKEFAKIWHPDRSGDRQAPDVMAHLVTLRDLALKRFAKATTGEFLFTQADGSKRKMNFVSHNTYEAGSVLVGSKTIAYTVEGRFGLFADTARTFVPAFANPGMQAQMAPFLPQPVFDTPVAGGHMFVYRKANDRVLMRDLIKTGPVNDPRHVAWMVTRMMNIAAWLEYAGISHSAISPDYLLVSPQAHTVSLTGPFLFFAGFGSRAAGYPVRTVDEVPRIRVAHEPVAPDVDLYLIRRTARELLGDSAGTQLLRNKDIPTAFAVWLTTPPCQTAAEDFKVWEQARDHAFGPQKFIRWDLCPADIYGM